MQRKKSPECFGRFQVASVFWNDCKICWPKKWNKSTVFYILSVGFCFCSWAWKHNSLGLQVSLLYCRYFVLMWTRPKQFALQFHCWAGLSKMLLFPSVKCTQYHILEVISPRMWFSFPHPPALKHTHPETHTCTHSLHACIHAYVLYLSLCWANTPLCLTCFLCHDDERHLLFSAETPLHPMLCWHPACIIHKSSGNSVTSRRVSTFVTWAEGKCRTAEWIHALKLPFAKRK